MIRRLSRVMGSDAAVLHRLVLSEIVAAALQGLAFALTVPLIRALLDPAGGRVWLWVGAEAAILVIFAVVNYRTKLLGLTSSRSITANLWNRLGDHLATLPLGWFSPDRVGTVARVTGAGVFTVTGFPTQMLGTLVSAFVTPAVVLAAMFVFEWRLALAALAAAPLLWLAYRASTRITETVDRRTHDANVVTANRLVEFAQTQPVLRAFGGVERGRRRLDDALVSQRRADDAMIGWAGVVGDGVFRLVVQAALTAILLVGIALAAGGRIGPVEAVAVLVLATRFVQPLLDGASAGDAVRTVRNNLDRIDAILDARPLLEATAPRTLGEPTIALERVHFSYDGDPVLSGVDLVAPARSMTAIVGPSGGGKTTITRLVARFWDVDSGSVSVGGVDVRELPTAELMSAISIVFQDVYLFAGSIRENVVMARPEATEEEITRAISLARVDEIAARLPRGLDTEVGESGQALSGGERQRVSIARAILKDAPIVLLDEATAALDAENEAHVQAALAALTADRTLLVVAHRLQTIAAADRIAFLQDGVVTETGSHDELLARGGRYADFWRERSRAAGWRLGARG